LLEHEEIFEILENFATNFKHFFGRKPNFFKQDIHFYQVLKVGTAKSQRKLALWKTFGEF
jgi:hypothetical protein